jgi:hypothetical protein
MRHAAVLLTGLLLAFLPAAHLLAATITIINMDPAGQGLNDPTPAAPVGGNPGTTIGAQRLNVFNQAAQIWGSILPGSVEIRVEASFTALPCTSTSAVLGGAGPMEVWRDFSGAPFPGIWYVSALANRLSGVDEDPSTSDIQAQFNKNLGQTGCLTGSGFYYGFDTNQGTLINFLVVSLHEFAHGLGFLSLVDDSSGTLLGGQGDIYSMFILDTTAGKGWLHMASDAERQASAINTGNVVWSGPNTNVAAAAYLAARPFLFVTAPPAVAGNHEVGTANFGAALTETGVSGTLIATTPSDACLALTNGGQVSGQIALVDRGSCSFTQKAVNVQAAGATGLVIANNVAGAPPMMVGTDPSITIPVVSVSQTDGASLRANLPAQVRIGLNPSLRSGADASGRVLLYVPNPVEPGSSISHFDTSAVPNLLMEPAVNQDLPIGVDITTDLFRDIGWFGVSAGSKFYTLTPCRIVDTRNPDGPLAGPALQPHDTRSFDVLSSGCRIPPGARAVSANISVTQGTAFGNLVIYPGDGSQPVGSAIN